MTCARALRPSICSQAQEERDYMPQLWSTVAHPTPPPAAVDCDANQRKAPRPRNQGGGHILDTLICSRTGERRSAAWRHAPNRPPPCNPRRGARTPALVCSLINKTARLMLATGGGQICGAQPGGWAPDARWARSRATDQRVNWARQRPAIYLKRQLAGRETAPQFSLNRMVDLRLRRGWTGHRPSASRSRRAEEGKYGARGITKN